MARKLLKKTNATLDNNTKLRRACLYTINSEGKLDELGLFLLNPSTYEDSINTKWVQQEIPGASNPLLQWISGGSRVLTFEALVTKDIHTEEELDMTNLLLNKVGGQAINALGAVASKVAGVNIPASAVVDLIRSVAKVNSALSIQEELDFFRRLLYPIYDKKRLVAAPPLVYLDIETTLTTNKNTIGMSEGDSITPSTLLWVITDLKVQITKQLPSLAPMEALLNFTMVQYTIENFSR
jgi:hypothetical protein